MKLIGIKIPTKRVVMKNREALVKAKVSHFQNGLWIVKTKDREYIVDHKALDFSNDPEVKKVYSLPTNTYYDETKTKEINYSKQLPEKAMEAWSKIKVGLIVKGIIKDGIFHIKRIHSKK